jgi:hypothetical protein
MILNKDFIKSFITNNQVLVDKKIVLKPVAYRWTHGATDLHMGDGLLIYSIIQYMRAKTCVCLGSGGGFIPRIMTQARVDLHDAEIFKGDKDYNWGDIGATFIVDAANNIGGEVDWLDEGSFLRKIFSPRILNTTTKEAYYNFFVKEDIKIDYLHIDAGHSYEDIKQDFELYSNLLSEHGVISIHDTDINYEENYIVTKDIADQNHHEDFANGPSRFIKEINSEWQKINMFNEGAYKEKPSSTGLTILKRA